MSPTRAAWERLAELLQQRRGHIDANAKQFAKQTGLNYRLVYDLEHAKRTNYRPAKIAEIERAYQWEPGSVDNVLNGGEPSPLPISHWTREDEKVGPTLRDDFEKQMWADTTLTMDQRLDIIAQYRANKIREARAQEQQDQADWRNTA